MSYYILPSVKIFDITNKFNIFFSNEEPNSFINKNLNLYLNNIKMQISNYSDKWDEFKKIF